MVRRRRGAVSPGLRGCDPAPGDGVRRGGAATLSAAGAADGDVGGGGAGRVLARERGAAAGPRSAPGGRDNPCERRDSGAGAGGDRFAGDLVGVGLVAAWAACGEKTAAAPLNASGREDG